MLRLPCCRESFLRPEFGIKLQTEGHSIVQLIKMLLSFNELAKDPSVVIHLLNVNSTADLCVAWQRCTLLSTPFSVFFFELFASDMMKDVRLAVSVVLQKPCCT